MVKRMLKLLIGYDGSPCANEAIDDLGRAGFEPENVDAVVMSVANVWPHSPGPEFTEHYPRAAATARQRIDDALQAAQTLAAQGQERVAELFPRWQVRAHAAADSPYWALVQHVQQWQADLLVVGSRGRSAIGRLVLGSVSSNAILYAECSVRISRCGTHAADSATRPARIVVGWDGSPNAGLAVRTVAWRRWPSGSEARIVIGLDSQAVLVAAALDPTVTGEQVETDAIGDTLRQSAQAPADELRGAGLLVGEPVLHAGQPAHLLVQEAQNWQADCIFVGAKGARGIREVLLGSVASAVAASAPCSVEVVRSRAPGRAA
jgi:nucleotide-binding universal stress UspA family protein